MRIGISLVNLFLRRAWTGRFRRTPCAHIAEVQPATPTTDVCEECVALGDTWPALRLCMTCCHLGCCEKAKNQHEGGDNIDRQNLLAAVDAGVVNHPSTRPRLPLPPRSAASASARRSPHPSCGCAAPAEACRRSRTPRRRRLHPSMIEADNACGRDSAPP